MQTEDRVSDAAANISLPLDEWLKALSALGDGPNPVCDQKEAEHVREFLNVLALGPPNLVAALDLEVESTAFDDLLMRGASESVMLRVVKANFGFMLSSSPGGTVLASAWLPVLREPVEATSSRIAGALIAACSQALIKAVLAGESAGGTNPAALAH
ncbi:hypothetical protein N8940_01745 [Sphingomonadaceae bacterium]|nr:hypothetical protein [Sphingomonadaceae bacterium]